ncbi:MAG: 30S ribosomal protein S24e [Candidatus Hodarchaeota archaeon]
MEIKIQSEKYNTLIGRKEVDILLVHLGEVTPTKEGVRSKVAAQLNLDLERVVIQSIRGHFGEPMSRVIVHCYDNAEDALVFEPKYRLKRNKIIETEVKS